MENGLHYNTYNVCTFTPMVKAKKHLGQHFLLDEGISERIAHALILPNNCNHVVEVGPGTGVLTKYLLKQPYQLKAVEIDGESITYLNQHYPTLEIIDQDFLRLDLQELYGNSSISIIGNFPYYISSQILFKAFDNRHQVVELVGMFQKEVAERVCEKPGSKKYGILSVLLQAFYEVEYLFTVHENAFNPPPKVKSGVMRMVRNNVANLPCDEKLFKQVVKLSFNQRRKTLRNSLKSILPDEVKGDEIFNKRPEQLGVNEFVGICEKISKSVG